MSVVGVFFVFYIALLLGLIAFSVVAYIFEAKGLYAVAKRRGFDKPWMAWIPMANTWLLGAVVDDYCIKIEKKETSFRKKILGFKIAFLACLMVFFTLFFIFVFSMLLLENTNSEIYTILPAMAAILLVVVYIASLVMAVFYCVYTYIALYKFFRSCQPSKAVLYLLLSIFVGVVEPFFVYAVRNSDEGMPADTLGSDNIEEDNQ